jgi:hypothetical protein
MTPSVKNNDDNIVQNPMNSIIFTAMAH